MKEQLSTNNVIVIRTVLRDEEYCNGCSCLYDSKEGDYYFCRLFLDERDSIELQEDEVGNPIRLHDCKSYFLNHKEAIYPLPARTAQ